MENEEITIQLQNEEKLIHQTLTSIIRKEEQFWRIKSKILWLKEGNRNLTFFHNQAKFRIIRNNIQEIHSYKGEKITNNEEIKTGLGDTSKIFPLNKKSSFKRM